MTLAVVLSACGSGPDADVPAVPTPADGGVAASAEAAAGAALGVGDRAPDFALADATGETVRLGALLLDGPVVLTFYRGAWCPYCNTHLRDLQTSLARIDRVGARLVAVSPQTPDSTLSTAERNALSFAVLSDPGNRVSRDYGLVFRVDDATRDRYRLSGVDLERYNGEGEAGWALPVPATYVIDRAGTIRAAFVEADYTQRTSAREILDALRPLV